jgi:uncharacterized low-complexity protein
VWNIHTAGPEHWRCWAALSALNTQKDASSVHHFNSGGSINMNKTLIIKPVAAAVGVAFVTSVALSTTALAADNPFTATDLESGYLLAGGDGEEGKCGEGKCGGDKGEEGSCGEGKGEEGSCGEGKGEEGSCGEGKGEEGSCGEGKGEEGSCGEDKGEEGKCGGTQA